MIGQYIAWTLGVAGFVLSLWNLFRDRPRVGLRTKYINVWDGCKENLAGLEVTALNVGLQDSIVSEISIVAQEVHTSVPAATKHMQFNTAETSKTKASTAKGALADEGPELPAVVAAHSTLRWTVSADFIKSQQGLREGVLVVEAKVLRPAWPWQVAWRWFRCERGRPYREVLAGHTERLRDLAEYTEYAPGQSA